MAEFRPILEENDDGTWRSSTPDLPSAFVVADTPEDAIAKNRSAWNGYREFCDDYGRRLAEFLAEVNGKGDT